MIQAGVADKFFRKSFIEGYTNNDSIILCCYRHLGVEIVIIISQRHFDGIVLPVHLPFRHRRDLIPLFGRRLQPHCAAGSRPYTMMDQFYPGGFFIKEESVILVAENENVKSCCFKIFQIIQFQFLTEEYSDR